MPQLNELHRPLLLQRLEDLAVLEQLRIGQALSDLDQPVFFALQITLSPCRSLGEDVPLGLQLGQSQQVASVSRLCGLLTELFVNRQEIGCDAVAA
jgi:hypothetical protein